MSPSLSTMAFATGLPALRTPRSAFVPSTTPLRQPLLLPTTASRANPARMSLSPLLPTPWSESNQDSPQSDDAAAWLESARREARAGNALAARHMYSCAVAATAGGDKAVHGKVWLAWAKLEAKRGDQAGAAAFEEVMQRATLAVPGDAHLWHFWGKTTLRGRGRASGAGSNGLSAARKILRRGMVACPVSAALRCELAGLESGAGNLETARKLYGEALDVDPRDSHVYMNFARFEQQGRRMRSARSIFAQGVKMVPKKDAAVLYTAFAKLEVDEGHRDQARFLYQRAAEANPSDRYIWQTWAAFEATNGDPDRARELFERGVVVTGGAVGSIWQAWGVLEHRQGRLQDARHLFSRGSRANPSDAATWAAWGRLEAGAGNIVEARRLFEHAGEQIGANTRAGALFLNWAMFEANEGNVEAACSLLRTAVNRRKDKVDDTIRLLHAWGSLEWRAGRPEKARPLFERALGLNPSDPRTVHSLARMELTTKRYSEARSLLRVAHRNFPSDTHIVVTLAKLEWQQFASEGGVGKARRLFSSGARTSPSDATLIREWAAFETAQGDVDLGKRLRSIAERGPDRPGTSRRNIIGRMPRSHSSTSSPSTSSDM